MFGQWCWVPEPPGLAWPPGAGAVVDGLELAGGLGLEVAGGLGLGLAASAGTENATTVPSAAAPRTGAPTSSSLRLSGMFASCNGFRPPLASGPLITLRASAQEAVCEALEFHWKWRPRAHAAGVMRHAVDSA